MIKFDLGPRKCGKTTRMVEWLRNTPNGVLAVVNMGMREAIISNFDLKHSEAKRIITHQQLLRDNWAGRRNNLLKIEDAEMLLIAMTPGWTFAGASMTIAQDQFSEAHIICH